MAKPIQAPGPFLKLMLEKYKLNSVTLSNDIHLSQSAVRSIIAGKTAITVPVALRLAKYFNTNPEYWLAQQMRYDLAEAGKDKALTKLLKSIPKAKKGSKAKEPSKGADAKPKAAARPKTAAKSKAAAKPKTSAKPKAAVKPKAAAKPRAPARPKAVAKPEAAVKPAVPDPTGLPVQN